MNFIEERASKSGHKNKFLTGSGDMVKSPSEPKPYKFIDEIGSEGGRPLEIFATPGRRRKPRLLLVARRGKIENSMNLHKIFATF